MVVNVKLKAVAVAAALVLSAPAASAATVSNCNPFVHGAACFTVKAKAANAKAPFVKLASFDAMLKGNRGRGNGQGKAFKAKAHVLASLKLNSAFPFLSSFAAVQTVALPVVFDASDDQTDVADSGSDVADGSGSDVAVVPVPASAVLLLAGLGGLAAMRRKRS